MIVSVDGDSIAGENSRGLDRQDQGPGRDGGDDRRARPRRAARSHELEVTRAQIALPVVTSKVKEVDGRKLGYVGMVYLQRRRRTRCCAKPCEKVREGRGRRDRARPARQRRRPARGGGAERQRLPARGRSRGDDRLAHPGPRRLQDRRRQPAEAADGRPDRPQHRLRGGDPHRGAGRRRRRQGGRHPLLRQGRLPAGDRPLQRRRAEADDRRVLHARRRQPRQEPRHPPRRARPATTCARPVATRRSNAPSGSWHRKDELAVCLCPLCEDKAHRKEVR